MYKTTLDLFKILLSIKTCFVNKMPMDFIAFLNDCPKP